MKDDEISWYPSNHSTFSILLKNHLTGETIAIDRGKLEKDEEYLAEMASEMARAELDNYDFSRNELENVTHFKD